LNITKLRIPLAKRVPQVVAVLKLLLLTYCKLKIIILLQKI
jgi:hypothetical protein